MFASWIGTAARAGKMEAVELPQGASGVRWCVVLGQILPADAEGWIQLQFYAGKPKFLKNKGERVCYSYHLPATFHPTTGEQYVVP